jgi:hypothetical protein
MGDTGCCTCVLACAYSTVIENPRCYRHRYIGTFLLSLKALSEKKELAKHSMPRLAASTIPRKRQETRLCVVGETNGEPVFDKVAQQLQQDSSFMSPDF